MRSRHLFVLTLFLSAGLMLFSSAPSFAENGHMGDDYNISDIVGGARVSEGAAGEGQLKISDPHAGSGKPSVSGDGQIVDGSGSVLGSSYFSHITATWGNLGVGAPVTASDCDTRIPSGLTNLRFRNWDPGTFSPCGAPVGFGDAFQNPTGRTLYPGWGPRFYVIARDLEFTSN